ncbi:hypothetical protein B0H14DRAFT_2632589 [Mycena olivaceomarginata]|nr:hypothetical protein B0H14DRAFT_2632589 [Mycena olivaceomarginata]
MPFFSNISGVNINGDNFYDVSSNINVQNNQQLAIQEHHVRLHTTVPGSQDALGGPSTSQQVPGPHSANGGHSSLLGVTRNSRHAGTGRPLPDDMTVRPQIHSQSRSEYPAGAVDGSRPIHLDNWPPLPDFIASNASNAAYDYIDGREVVRRGNVQVSAAWYQHVIEADQRRLVNRVKNIRSSQAAKRNLVGIPDIASPAKKAALARKIAEKEDEFQDAPAETSSTSNTALDIIQQPAQSYIVPRSTSVQSTATSSLLGSPYPSIPPSSPAVSIGNMSLDLDNLTAADRAMFAESEHRLAHLNVEAGEIDQDAEGEDEHMEEVELNTQKPSPKTGFSLSDLQGSDMLLTDPQIMTSPYGYLSVRSNVSDPVSRKIADGKDIFGGGNVGSVFENFPKQHICNVYCSWFNLPVMNGSNKD